MQSRLSYEDARTEIQASDSELDRALKDRHILNINGDQTFLLC
jgi:sister chromatid cohesion protein DCC1